MGFEKLPYGKMGFEKLPYGKMGFEKLLYVLSNFSSAISNFSYKVYYKVS